MGQIFKDEDRVFHIQYGWGEVIDVTCFDVSVKFDTGDIRHISGDAGELLSFTEYTLEGFSQERLEELPDVGQVVWVRKIFPSEWIIGHFREKKKDRYCISSCNNEYNDFGDEITTINPYANEHN